MRIIHALVLVLLAAAPAQAQQLASTFDQLRVLIKQNDTLTITDTSGQRLRGKVSTVSSSRLVLDVSGTVREFQDSNVEEIRMRRPDSLGNGALTGMAIGAGLAVAAVASQASANELGWIPLVALVYGGIGAGIGVGVDALIERDRVIYARSTPAISIAPMSGHRQRGVFVSVRLRR